MNEFYKLSGYHRKHAITLLRRPQGEEGVAEALERIRRAMPFPLRGLDSDNGSEFINFQLVGYCRDHQIHFTRGRP